MIAPLRHQKPLPLGVVARNVPVYYRDPLYMRGGRKTLGQYENESWGDGGGWDHYAPDYGLDAGYDGGAYDYGGGFDLSTLGPPELPPEMAPPELPSTPFDFAEVFGYEAPPAELAPLMDFGFTEDEAAMIAEGAAQGYLTETDFQAILTGNIAPEDLQAFIFGGGTGVMYPGLTPQQRAAAQEAQRKAAAAGGGAPSGGGAAGGGAKQPQPSQQPPKSGTTPATDAKVKVPGTSWWEKQSIPGVPNALLVGGLAFVGLFFFMGPDSGSPYGLKPTSASVSYAPSAPRPRKAAR